MKIIDGFIFYNELQMLHYRLSILYDVVDYFILVESTHTHIGKEKPLFYEENKEQFAKFQDKIIHIIVDDFPYKYPNIDISKGEQWKNENYQRDCIKKGFEKIELDEKDVLLISDLDEIIDPKLLTIFKHKDFHFPIKIHRLEQDFYYYNLNSKQCQKWYFAKVVSYGTFCELSISCNDIRHYNQCTIFQKGGWHLSYFGDSKFIQNKIQNFTHQEYNDEKYTNVERIEEKIKDTKCLFNEDSIIQKISISENDYLPPFYDVYLTGFYTQ